MALVGGGGAGNVAGSNPTGTGTQLNYIGRDPTHAYAYSGEVTVNDNETTLLDFTLGANQYFIGKVQFNYYGTTNQDSQHNIKINGELVQRYNTAAPSTYTEPDGTIPIIFAGGDRVQLTSKNITDSGNITVIVSIVGRVYA